MFSRLATLKVMMRTHAQRHRLINTNVQMDAYTRTHIHTLTHIPSYTRTHAHYTHLSYLHSLSQHYFSLCNCHCSQPVLKLVSAIKECKCFHNDAAVNSRLFHPIATTSLPLCPHVHLQPLPSVSRYTNCGRVVHLCAFGHYCCYYYYHCCCCFCMLLLLY